MVSDSRVGCGVGDLAKAFAVVAIVLAMVVLGACGSDDDPGDGNQANSPAAGDQASSDGASGASGQAGGSDDDQVKAVYDEFVKAVYAHDGQAACALMTPQAAARFGRQEDTTCPKRIQSTSGQISENRPRVYQVQVQGNRALAQAGTPKTAKYPVPFTKTDEGWQISGGF